MRTDENPQLAGFFFVDAKLRVVSYCRAVGTVIALGLLRMKSLGGGGFLREPSFNVLVGEGCNPSPSSEQQFRHTGAEPARTRSGAGLQGGVEWENAKPGISAFAAKTEKRKSTSSRRNKIPRLRAEVV